MIVLSDGRTVRVSVPVPDRISLVVTLHEGIFGAKAPKGLTVADWVKHAGQYLMTEPHNAHQVSNQYFGGWYKQVTLGMGQRGAGVRFEFALGNKKTAPYLRLEFNPRKLGPKGANTLLKILNDPAGPFNGKAVLQEARVTRLDVAVDILGVQTDDLLVTHGKERQRSLYLGTDGLLETVLLHGKHTKTKPAGAVLAMVYDRVRERAKRGKPPPYGPSPVSRLEVVKKLKAPGNNLAKLGCISDPFGEVRLAYVMDQQATPPSWWLQYVGLRRSKSHAAAVEMLGLGPLAAEAFKNAFDAPTKCLVEKTTTFEGWSQGLAWTGLKLLIGYAQ